MARSFFGYVSLTSAKRCALNLSKELFESMSQAIGLLQGVLVHAYTPAFHRIPRVYAKLGEDFASSEEVREVLDAIIRLLHARQSQAAPSHRRESEVLTRLESLKTKLGNAN